MKASQTHCYVFDSMSHNKPNRQYAVLNHSHKCDHFTAEDRREEEIELLTQAAPYQYMSVSFFPH